jgi:uncharacterized membrane protein YcfT
MWAQRIMWIVWPAFLLAGVLEILVFAMVDPDDMRWAGQPIALSRQTVYSLSFFVFWIVIAASNALTTLLSLSPSELNRSPTAQTDTLK